MLKPLLFFFFAFSYLMLSQSFKSTHQIENEEHTKLHLDKATELNTSTSIIPLNKQAEKNLSKSVFGYLPYWEYSAGSHRNIQFDLLTHIAVFNFDVNSGGAITEPANWPWTDLINDAHASGTKVIMVLVNFTASDIHTIMTSSISKWIFMNGVKSNITQYKLDGVNIDFEGLNLADRGSVVNDFMKELTETVHSLSPDLEVSFAAPAVNWGGWDLTGLAQSCDYLFVMGYDFFGSWSSTTGPSAPLIGGNYNVTNTIFDQYATVTQFYPEKLILGVPYFGPHWTTVTGNEGSNIINYERAERFRDAQPFANTYGVNWSTKYKNTWYNYSDGSKNHQVWFDNDSSLSLKYDLAISKKLKGVGMWALGYDGARTELWDLLSKKFSIPVTVHEEISFPNKVHLFNNYPNPFNPSTIINYQIQAQKMGYMVNLTVHDIMGREIKILVDEPQATGSYQVSFDASELSSGVYYYTLSFGDYKQTNKMLLIK